MSLVDETHEDVAHSAAGAPSRVPILFVVLEGGRPLSGGARFSLVGVERITIGRITSRVLGAHDGRDGFEAGRVWFSIRGAPCADGALLRDEDASRSAAPFGLRTLLPELAERHAALARVARNSAVPVLFLGPTGSGKVVLARAVHAQSGRAGPFVAVNCGALPSTPVEALLFGHMKGAFSGAARDEIGFVRSAEGGHALPRRDRRPPRVVAGRAAAGSPGARGRAGGRDARREDRRARPLGDAPPPCDDRRERRLPQRSPRALEGLRPQAPRAPRAHGRLRSPPRGRSDGRSWGSRREPHDRSASGAGPTCGGVSSENKDDGKPPATT